MELSEAMINGRFRYLERPAIAPGKCAVCGAVDRPVVDIGLDLDFYGVVYFCVDCLGEASRVANAHATDTVPQAVPLSTLLDFEAVNEYLRSVSKSLDRVTAILPDHYFDVPDDEDGTELSVEDAERTDRSNSEPVSDAQGDGGSGNESSVVEGSDDLPSVSSSISF